MILKIFFSIMLFLSGITVLMDPYFLVNSLPAFLPAKLDVISGVGALNILLSIGLFVPKLRQMTIILSAAEILIILLIALNNFIQ